MRNTLNFKRKNGSFRYTNSAREWLDGEGIDPVLEGPKIGPVYNGAYKHSDGNWYTQWSNN